MTIQEITEGLWVIAGLVVIGAMVLVLALGVFLPMWDLARASRGG